MGHTPYRFSTGRADPFDGTPVPIGSHRAAAGAIDASAAPIHAASENVWQDARNRMRTRLESPERTEAPVTLVPAKPIPASPSAILPGIGPLLKRLRIEADLTQEALAERSELSVRVVSDLERGIIRRPRRDTVQMLADGLGLVGPERDAFVKVARRRHALEPSAIAQTPAKLPEPTVAIANALPLPPTALVGREREVAATASLLLNGQTRLLTLTGPGGVGKTRLAIEVASCVRDAFPDGVAFVELAPLRDPALVLPAIARALDVRDDGAPARSLHERLVAALAGRRLLLTLDNCEHLTAAAIAIADLLADCPTLTVLATSRQPLRLRIERVYEVPPLALPELNRRPPVGELARIPAVDLFVRRAEAARRGFALVEANAAAVAEIAVTLDGLPLALELAAARMKVLSPAALLARLENRLPLLTGGAKDLPARQQTLRATIEWSHDLLSPSEQALFRSLSVFVGGFTIEAAESISRGVEESRSRGVVGSLLDSSPSRLLDSLGALVDKSLVQVIDAGDDRRFAMLETIREFGLERLAAAGEAPELRRRHVAWCLDLAERAEPELAGPEQGRWLALLEAEHGNLRAALGWAIVRRDAETALRLGGALHRFWNLRGHYAEGRGWLEQALALDGNASAAMRAKALLGTAVMAHYQDDDARATACDAEALALFKALGDTAGIAAAHQHLGIVALAQGDYTRAATHGGAALTRSRDLGDPRGLGTALNLLGLVAYAQGEHGRAATLLEEAVAVERPLEDRNALAYSLNNRALVALAQGDSRRAAALQEEALALWRRSGNMIVFAHSFENLAMIAAARSDYARAGRLVGATEALRERIGAPGRPSNRDQRDRYIALDRDQRDRYLTLARVRLGADAYAAAREEGRAMPLDEALAFALDRDRQPAASEA
jgi:predicted ATPase/transcriptional regulator with XRE-family HTH domain